MKEIVSASQGAKPKGPYSQGVIASGRQLYIAAQAPVDPATGAIVAGEFPEQAARAFANVQAIVEAAGGTMADVVQITVYLSDWKHMPELNAVWGRFFSPPYPVRTPVKCATPIGDILLAAIAALPERTGEDT